MKITDLAYDQRPQFAPQPGQEGQRPVKSPWRADLQPASFRNAFFHVEASGIESGRRVVMHEFPKKNTPYAEDMGRRAFEFTVRAYCIQYPRDVEGAGLELYRRDYRIARDLLAQELTSGEPGPLRLPNFKGREITVICPRYRLTEEERAGGYCVFDITFVELGVAPREPPPDSRDELIKHYEQMLNRIKEGLSGGAPSSTSGTGATDA